MSSQTETIILGGGMTGLAAGFASGLPIYEASERPGGICSSYYIRSSGRERLAEAPGDGEAYRFEFGGGHWIFGGDPTVLALVDRLAPVRTYQRKSSVFFHDSRTYVPYPLQNHLRLLDRQTATRSLGEMLDRKDAPVQTMADWLQAHFGKMLCELFFFPFHELYTAGLYSRIAPQDPYKSPLSRQQVIQGALEAGEQKAGYNVSYVYPEGGLNRLADQLASRANVRYGKRVTKIDPEARIVQFADGEEVYYRRIIATLPLNKLLEMTGLGVQAKTDPHTSVLVLNLGAVKGPRCPDDHWTYNCNTKSRFHRVGFYSNVDASFLPASHRQARNRVSIYVERGYVGGEKPSEAEVQSYCRAVIRELQDWEYIGEVEATDPTWIDVAYTWSWPGSRWVPEALSALQRQQIYPVGRYARWTFQGIADSIRDGFMAGSSFR